MCLLTIQHKHKFYPWNPYGCRRELNSISCLLSSTFVVKNMQAHTILILIISWDCPWSLYSLASVFQGLRLLICANKPSYSVLFKVMGICHKCRISGSSLALVLSSIYCLQPHESVNNHVWLFLLKLCNSTLIKHIVKVIYDFP